jgi:hypothetical protein
MAKLDEQIDSAKCNCERCGRPCRTAAKSEPDSLLIRKSTVPKGLCVDCAITCFIKTGPLKEVMGGPLSAPGFTVEKALSLPHVQDQFAAVFRAAKCSDVADEICWDRVIENWELELPKGWDWKGEIYLFANG